MRQNLKRIVALLSAVALSLSNPLQAFAGEEVIVSDELSIEENPVLEEDTTETESVEEIEEDDENAEIEETVVLDEEGLEAEDAVEEAEPVEIEETDNLLLTSGGDITRLEVWKMLIGAYHMSVAADNYPDNYFIDLSSSDSYYRDIMVATEFGLVDADMGEAARPNDIATREFIAHVFNTCAGFSDTYDTSEYTFSEYADVSYANDIQVAIDNNWFTTTDGFFYPDEGISAAELNSLKAIAQSYYEESIVYENYASTYSLKTGVRNLGEQDADITGDHEITIYNQTISDLNAGDKIVIIFNGIPFAYLVENSAVSGGNTIISYSDIAAEEVFDAYDVQSVQQIDLSTVNIDSEEEMEVTYLVGGTPENEYEDGQEFDSIEEIGDWEISAVKATATIPNSSFTYKNSDSGVKVTVKLSGLECDIKGNLATDNAQAHVKGTFTASVSINTPTYSPKLVEDFFKNFKVDVPFGLIGHFTVTPEVTFSGNFACTSTTEFDLGVNYQNGRMRFVNTFKKQDFTLSCQTELEVHLKDALGFDAVVIKGEIYLTVGAAANVEVVSHALADPCLNVRAYLIVKVGASLKIIKPFDSIEFKKEWEYWGKKNSPIKINMHFEDGQQVEECTRLTDTDKQNAPASSNPNIRYGLYYTPVNSRYATGGLISGTGSDRQHHDVYTYTVDSNTLEVTITKYNGDYSVVRVPDRIDGHPVTAIGKRAFSLDNKLYEVILPETITKIDNNAFAECKNLSVIDLPSNLKSIGEMAFYNCKSLTELTIPAGVTTIGRNAFSYAVKEITFAQGMEIIPQGACYVDTYLEVVKIPDSVREIGKEAFKECDNLKKVTGARYLNTIGYAAFSGCTSLTNIPDAETIGVTAFLGCKSLTSWSIPGKLRTIQERAFASCGFTELYFPATLNNIYYDAFKDNPLNKVTYAPGTIKITGGCGGVKKPVNVIIPDTVTEIGNFAFYEADIESLKLPPNLKIIGEDAFYLADIKDLEIPSTVESIGDDAFYGCTTPQLIVPAGIKYIGEAALDAKKIIFADGTTQISCDTKKQAALGYAYVGLCGRHVEEVVMPDTVTTLGKSVFSHSAIRKARLSNKLTEIPEYAFGYDNMLSEVNIPISVTEIRSMAFSNKQSYDPVLTVYYAGSEADWEKIDGAKYLLKATNTEIVYGSDTPAPDPEEEPEEETSVYTVTFFVNNKEYAKAEVKEGEFVKDLPSDPIGETAFIGWYDMATGGKWNIASPVTKDLNLEARFSSEEASESKSGMNPGLKVTDGYIYGIKGQTLTLDTTYKWTSANTKIASISKKGVITLKAAGETDIIGTSGSTIKNVSVIIKAPSLNKTKFTMIPGQTDTLVVNSLGDKAGKYGVAWISSNPSIVTVENGTVSALRKGSVTVSAYINGKAFNCKVTVKDTAAVKTFTGSIVLTPLQSVTIKQSGFKASAAFWISSKNMEVFKNAKGTKTLYYQDDVVRITPAGKMTAVGVGTTTIEGVDQNNNRMEFEVTVNEPATQVIYLNKGQKTTLKYYGVTNKKALWSVKSGSGAVVDTKGVVTATEYGKNEINCSYNPYATGGFIYKTIVYVESPELKTDATLKNKNKKTDGKYVLELKPGATYQLKFQNIHQKPFFKSSKTNVAYVDENGVIHAVSTGKTNITAKINGKTVTVYLKIS